MNAEVTGIENRFDLQTKVETMLAVFRLPNGAEVRAPITQETAAYIIQSTMPGTPAAAQPPAAAAFMASDEFGGDYQPPTTSAASTPIAAEYRVAPVTIRDRAWDPSQGPVPSRTVQKDDAGNPIVPGRSPFMNGEDADEDGVPSL